MPTYSEWYVMVRQLEEASTLHRMLDDWKSERDMLFSLIDLYKVLEATPKETESTDTEGEGTEVCTP